MPDEHPLVLGMPGFWGLEITNEYARNADVVLAIGTRFAETDSSSWDPALHLADPADAADPDRHRPGGDRPQLPGGARRRRRRRRGRSRRSPRRCAPSRPKAVSGPRCATRSAAARTELFDASAARGDERRSSRCGPSGSSPTCAPRCPPDAVLVTDVGWNKNGVAQCYHAARATGRFITPGGASTMGFGPAAALGVQLGRPDARRRRPHRRRRHERPAAGRADWPSSGACR